MSTLFYVIGASGSGKDTLMNYARQQINGSENVLFAHRYITRPPFAGNENHISLSNQEFELRRDANLFALNWGSHNKYYGIGREIDSWMQSGFNVVVNGSREYLPVARQLYPDLKVILITASSETIARRLMSRGREDAAEIQTRIARTAQINTTIDNCIKIQNDNEVEDAGNKLVNIISVTEKLYI